MARREVFDCDRCQKEGVTCRHFELYVGRQSNGVDHDDVYRCFDLCLLCCSEVLMNQFSRGNAQGNIASLQRFGLDKLGRES